MKLIVPVALLLAGLVLLLCGLAYPLLRLLGGGLAQSEKPRPDYPEAPER